jgi:hypothetical protein
MKPPKSCYVTGTHGCTSKYRPGLQLAALTSLSQRAGPKSPPTVPAIYGMHTLHTHHLIESYSSSSQQTHVLTLPYPPPPPMTFYPPKFNTDFVSSIRWILLCYRFWYILLTQPVLINSTTSKRSIFFSFLYSKSDPKDTGLQGI